jgi:twitching motility two-component system response regulator PilH
MSETIAMPPLGDIETRSVPTVYFIDDSATMREVIKIAFRRESIHVITCADAASALSQFDQNPPDVVITDVIMPDQDGYSVCSQIKQNPQFAKTPVILMSGVVNKSVADRAVAVQADELVRKPFQPQELIGRVKNLLAIANPATKVSTQEEHPVAVPSLTGLFAAQPTSTVHQPKLVPPPAPVVAPPVADAKSADSVWPRALAEAFIQQNAAQTPQAPQPLAPASTRPTAASPDALKLRAEITRLDLLVKKLHTELQIERQYNQALELHVRSLIQID